MLDAYALVAFPVGGPAAAEVRAILREGDVGVTTANLAETLEIAERLYKLPVARAFGALQPLLQETLTAVPLDIATAHRAAELRVGHHHRRECPISLADTVFLASISDGDRLATADPDVLAVAEAEKIETVPLPSQS